MDGMAILLPRRSWRTPTRLQALRSSRVEVGSGHAWSDAYTDYTPPLQHTPILTAVLPSGFTSQLTHAPPVL